jgi:hypothetical protein
MDTCPGYAMSVFKYTILRKTSEDLIHCRLDDPDQADEFFDSPDDRIIRIGITEFVRKKPYGLGLVKISQKPEEG